MILCYVNCPYLLEMDTKNSEMEKYTNKIIYSSCPGLMHNMDCTLWLSALRPTLGSKSET